MIWKYSGTVWLLLIIGIVEVSGQSAISGRISNSDENTFVPFVNIRIETKQPTGTVSNIEGYYRLILPADTRNTDSVRFSCVGYQTLYKSVGSLRQKADIELKPQSEKLDEVVIKPGEDPAYAIMKHVVDQRDVNRPESLPHFKFTSYNKANIDVARSDSIQADLENTGFRNAHFFMLESATEVVYQKPGKWNETVLKKKISGITNPTMSLLSNSFQPFTCYDDYLNIAGFKYLNPISPNSGARYSFTLRDTVQIDGDTVFVIHFSPRKNAAEELMEGTLSIAAKTYALVNFRGSSTGDYRLLNFEIRQAYSKTNGIWFPHESNTTYRIPDSQSGIEFIASSSTFIRNPNLEYIPRRGDFGIARVNIASDRTLPDSLWNEIRATTLTPQEANTYAVYDTLPKSVLGPMNWIMKQSEALASGRLNFGPIDVLTDKLIDYNPYEGFRLGVGLATSHTLINWMSVEGYVAYGFKDKQVKYGGGMRFFIEPSRELELSLFYKNDLKEPGFPKFTRDIGFLNGGTIVHNLFIRRMNPLEQYKASLSFRPARGFRAKVSFTREELEVQPQDYYYDAGYIPKPIIATLATLELRYTPGESLLQSGSNFIPLNLSYPRFTFSVTRALSDVFQSNTSFTQLRFQVEHELKIRGIGSTKLFGFASKTSGHSIAYPYLFFGRGGHGENNFGILSTGYFQTMGLYDYLSDEFVQVGFIHNFGSIFGIKKRYSKPELKLAYQAAVGNLSNSNATDIPFAYAKMDHAYLEGGLIIDNILRLSNTFYYGGYGVGVFYRNGYYASPKFSDNLSFILSFAISL